jgi:hypothetical protein
VFASQNLLLALRPRLSSANSVPSALKSPRSLTTQLTTRPHQPNHSPLFPLAVCIAPTETLGNPSPSIVYFTASRDPGDGGTHPLVPARSRSLPSPRLAPTPHTTRLNATLTRPTVNTHSKALTPKLSPLDTAFTKNLGGPTDILFFSYLDTSLRHYVLASNSLNYSESQYHDP